jgi:lipopolysaccharide export system permease protein
MMMFILLLLLIDLFLNLVHYLNYDASMAQILMVSVYYIPKAADYALPISLLFAVAYTLGDLYARNELTSVVCSGIPFWRFAAPLIIIGAFASVFAFFFEDLVVIPTLSTKNQMSAELKHQTTQENNSELAVKTRGGRRIYYVDYLDIKNSVLNGVIIVEWDEDGRFISQIRANRATWNDKNWQFTSPIVYSWHENTIVVNTMPPDEAVDNDYTESPEVFRRSGINPEDLQLRDARELVQDLQQAGLPYTEAQADYYHRYSFAFVSFIVIILSVSMGGRFRKNIMLMSLLASLGTAVVYYVMEMISMMLARMGYIPPIVGAWFPVAVFSLVGAVLTRYSKT